jgi:hypothetical protein
MIYQIPFSIKTTEREKNWLIISMKDWKLVIQIWMLTEKDETVDE